MPTTRHDQSPYAALKIWQGSWRTFTCSCSILRRSHRIFDVIQTKARGFIATGAMIARRETPLALYKGLGAVLSGIVPKMAVRFASFEHYKTWLADKETGKTAVGNIFVGSHIHISSRYPLLTPTFYSRVGSGYDRSRPSRNTDGSREDPSASTATLPRRSTRGAPIPQCRSCSVHYHPRRRLLRTVPRCEPHGAPTSHQPRFASFLDFTSELLPALRRVADPG